MTTAQQTEAFIEKILHLTRGAFEIFGMYIGVRLGYYRALSKSGPANSKELAEQTETYERCAREWLEQQAICGILAVDDESIDAKSRRYTLPEPYQDVLADEESLNYLGALPVILAGALRPLHAVVQAYRTGEGVAYGDYGPDLVEGRAGMNRTMFLKEMGSSWLPKISDLHRRLLSDRPAAGRGRRRGSRMVEHRDRKKLSKSADRWIRFRSAVG